MSFLILACSKTKKSHTCPAEEMYTGMTFKSGLVLARHFNLEVFILSAKYGLIKHDTIIETYDEKLTSQYTGKWPEGDGFYLGGPLYFGNAPARIKSLVPNGCKPGVMSSYCKRMVGFGTLDYKKLPANSRGIIQAIYEICQIEPISKAGLYVKLCAEFGENPTMKITINCQLLQSRMGKSHNCTIIKNNDTFAAL